MNTITRRATLGALALPALFGRASAQPVRLRFAHPHPDSDSWNRASQMFARLVTERSNGALQVQVDADVVGRVLRRIHQDGWTRRLERRQHLLGGVGQDQTADVAGLSLVDGIDVVV